MIETAKKMGREDDTPRGAELPDAGRQSERSVAERMQSLVMPSSLGRSEDNGVNQFLTKGPEAERVTRDLELAVRQAELQNQIQNSQRQNAPLRTPHQEVLKRGGDEKKNA